MKQTANKNKNQMIGPTKKQQHVLDFIQKRQQADGVTPSVREIAAHFGWASPRSVSDHLDALRRKGLLRSEPGLARSYRVVSRLTELRKRVVDIPIFGSIPAGMPSEQHQEAKGCVTIDVGSVGIKPTPRTFALEVRGDSMIGRHIVDGDMVVVEHGQAPRNGDVVAALIDGESTLKTYVADRKRPHLKAENPRYPKLTPVEELTIQGVMVALIRKTK